MRRSILVKNPLFKKAFEKEYAAFLWSELLIDLMKDSRRSVQNLAESVGLSPTIIQNLRSGKQQDFKMRNFVNIAGACGYHLVLEEVNRRIEIS